MMYISTLAFAGILGLTATVADPVGVGKMLGKLGTAIPNIEAVSKIRRGDTTVDSSARNLQSATTYLAVTYYSQSCSTAASVEAIALGSCIIADGSNSVMYVYGKSLIIFLS